MKPIMFLAVAALLLTGCSSTPEPIAAKTPAPAPSTSAPAAAVKVAPAVTGKLSDAEFYAKVRASSKLLTGNDASLDALATSLCASLTNKAFGAKSYKVTAGITGQLGMDAAQAKTFLALVAAQRCPAASSVVAAG